MTLFCLSLSKIQESECVASSSEQNCAIFVMMVMRESACAACLAILAGNKAGEINKPISMTYHIKIDVNPFCFSDLHLLYGQDLCLSKHQGLVYCCVNWDRPR